MRKLFRKQILLLTVLAVFFGCTANGGSKDIVKGLIDRDFSDLYVSVNALVQCGEDFVCQTSLDDRRLQGDNARDDERHE